MNQRNRRTIVLYAYFGLLIAVAMWLSACGRPELTLSSESSISLPATADSQETGSNAVKSAVKRSEPADSWYVQVSGAVLHPGVYQIAPDSRVFRLIEMAGGFTEEAEASAINQAVRLRDGQQLYVPTKAEVQAAPSAGWVGQNGQTESGTASLANGSKTGGADNGRININTATAEQLCTLPGIGEAKAADIIAYRTENGGFSDPQQLMEIAGIKKGVYENIKDRIDIE